MRHTVCGPVLMFVHSKFVVLIIINQCDYPRRAHLDEGGALESTCRNDAKISAIRLYLMYISGALEQLCQ